MIDEALYRQYLNAVNDLCPEIQAALAQAVDDGDQLLVKRIHRRLKSVVRDVAYYRATQQEIARVAS